MKIDLDDTELKTLDADPRGRVHLGPEYADARVTIAVVRSVTDADDEGGEE